ncbi:hypothetical protein TNCV_54311 [Trichonephila clavipes]|nr:hypothetical protein TNCV_54311 [Trichonephila clavipes]
MHAKSAREPKRPPAGVVVRRGGALSSGVVHEATNDALVQNYVAVRRQKPPREWNEQCDVNILINSTNPLHNLQKARL